MEKNQTGSFLNLPNSLTLLRMALVPVFLVLVVHKRAVASLSVFALAGLTDVLDGFAARVLHQKSKTGVFLDPAADKLLMIASFIILSFPSLSIPNAIPPWLTSVVISRDVLIALGAYITYRLRGLKTFYPSLLGKTCTVTQVGTVCLVLLFNALRTSPLILVWVFVITLVVTVVSGLHYFITGLAMYRQPPAK